MGNYLCSDGFGYGVGIKTDMILFNIKELNAYTDAFSEREFLGEGAFGRVYHGIISGRMEGNINGQEVAVKLFRNRDGGRSHWQAEKEYLPQLLHENIIELIGYCEVSEKLYLIYPFMENGTVLSKLAGLKWRTTLTIIKGIASAIQMLHRQKPSLIYRDLKLDNVLLYKDFTPKLADFGMVTPEQVHLQSSTRPHDIYKLGVIILQLLMKEENASSPRVGFCHISNWARRIYMQNKHAVMHIALTSTGCSERDAIVVTELALDCVKAKATERPDIAEVIHTLGNL